MFRRNNRTYNLLLVVVDIFVLLLAFVGAYVARVTLDNRPLLDQVYAYEYLLSSLIILPSDSSIALKVNLLRFVKS